MTSLVQISDPHFGTERPEVVSALLAWVKSMQPQVVLLSGDITQRARATQFAAAAEFAQGLGDVRVLAIPGNHDLPLNPWPRLFSPYANYQRAFGAELEPSFESEELVVLTVNTTRAYRHKHGEISAEQIERVCERLRKAGAAQLRVVVVHQPVHVTRRQDRNNLLRGSERAIPRWCAAGVDLVLGGHIHLPYVRSLAERFADLQRRCWVVQAGTAVSRRVRDSVPNSVNRICLLEGLHCQVERWDYVAARASFECVEQHLLVLDRSHNPGPQA